MPIRSEPACDTLRFHPLPYAIEPGPPAQAPASNPATEPAKHDHHRPPRSRLRAGANSPGAVKKATAWFSDVLPGGLRKARGCMRARTGICEAREARQKRGTEVDERRWGARPSDLEKPDWAPLRQCWDCRLDHPVRGNVARRPRTGGPLLDAAAAHCGVIGRVRLPVLGGGQKDVSDRDYRVGGAELPTSA
jgi:hypothetical protein